MKSGPLSRKETRQVIASLEEQGARINKIKSGVRVLFPNGSTTAIHWTTSDYRATKNMRADIKRAGLTWPFDDQRGMTMHARTEAARAKMVEGIEQLGRPFTVRELAATSGVSDVTIARHLPEMGYVATPGGGRHGNIWVPRESYKPDFTADFTDFTLDSEEGRAAFPEPVSETPEPEVPGWKTPEERWNSGTIVGSIDMKPGSVVTVGPHPTVQPQQPREREFIDSADSWTIEVPDKLQRLAARLGLNIEVRVWHEQ